MKSFLVLLVVQLTFIVSITNASERINDRVPTEFTEQGQPITLEIIIFKPTGPGPFPTLIFNHGSTGWGDTPAKFKRSFTADSVVYVFNKRGWAVAFPQRRGRGKSDGLYDEGFVLDHSRYSCSPQLSLPGLERALNDLDPVVKYLKERSDIDSNHLLIGGQSRGGILSIAYAGKRPELFKGVVNFVGGWTGRPCNTLEEINTVSFKRGASFDKPTLWMYGENDNFYSLNHSRSNFEAFTKAGGKGSFLTYSLRSGKNGHGLLYYPILWIEAVDSYINKLK